jgi:hypothetical protein
LCIGNAPLFCREVEYGKLSMMLERESVVRPCRLFLGLVNAPGLLAPGYPLTAAIVSLVPS